MYQQKGTTLPGFESASATNPASIRVSASARLHLGFLDLHGGLGRRFGSLGLAVSSPAVDLVVSDAERLIAEGEEAERVLRYAEAAAHHLQVEPRGHFRLRRSIIPHAGLGSGTQIALAVAAGLARLRGRPFQARDAAEALDRGNRSSAGLAAFEKGGLVLDGGRGEDDRAPPILARLPFPEDWRVLLVFDTSSHGLHGEAEVSAFRQLPPFPEAAAAHLCRLALMRILPAAAGRDVEAFGAGVAELQRVVGDHFASAQGGRFTSPIVTKVLAACEQRGFGGIGQSSWGPTGFVIIGSDSEARRLVAELKADGLPPGIRLEIVRGRNQGAQVRINRDHALKRRLAF
ncbi:beta-ribofuranosylaminobenzene 5'-phosphate synthase family protein [Labrys sp. WJW]|uniref:beta-ribofuranosylaminobenzene 5'-phosphate synthase family protein n=1 Tax=Labrys sp. WJW TaxID=1737983 RepID=UPI0009EDA964|nr:beta-ribofuranosylaminobenzene 5'-phosphate synthase family protein [Labrys sp. WJW]